MDFLIYGAIFIVSLIIGIIIGIIIDRAIMKKKTVGRLRIDRSEPYEPPRMFLELKGITPDIIAMHKIVTFEVINENYLSRN